MRSKAIGFIARFLVLTVLAGIGCSLPLDDARLAGTREDLKSYALNLERYRLTQGGYPRVNGLGQLFAEFYDVGLVVPILDSGSGNSDQEPKSCLESRGPSPDSDRVCFYTGDAWGVEITYRSIAEGYVLYSCGPDRICQAWASGASVMSVESDDLVLISGKWATGQKRFNDISIAAEAKKGEASIEVDFEIEQEPKLSSWTLKVYSTREVLGHSGDLDWNGNVGSIWRAASQAKRVEHLRSIFRVAEGAFSLVAVVEPGSNDENYSNNVVAIEVVK